ncbi:non-ribosomal peptide synthetase/MFS transporter [Acrocarpospora catenulata]|uniref:non-ribosomal peptide synthetase/MFS transporter n=1 Tax=Acrocarpospora catenulata TaxID=2836182 RepID=UPI001BDAB7BF|nr:non-ribosomal peptide synthetase/MFS transporter [Acrocarpospora catenulata]
MTHSPDLSQAKQALLRQRLRRRTVAAAISPREPGTAPPLSHAQERLWFLEQYRPGTAAYTVPFAVWLEGPLDPDALAEALRQVTARHETLRTRFRTSEDGLPSIDVADEPEIDLTVLTADTADQAKELISVELARPFDLAKGPLLRTTLVRLGPERHVLQLAAHHAVTDGWSGDVLLGDLLAMLGGRPLKPLPIQYGDYAIWQRARTGTPAYQADVAYWRDRLTGVPPLDLPADLPRPAEQSPRGAGHGFVIPRALEAAVAELGAAHGATPYMTFMAALQVLLGRWSGQEDFAVGSPISGRGLPELDGLVGMFVNTLALRADLDGDPAFTDLLGRVKDAALDAFSHQELPFDQLVNELNVARDVSRTPIFQVMFALQNYQTGAAPAAGAVQVSGFAADVTVSRFDLALYLYEGVDGMAATFIYCTDLFTAETIERLAASFVALLRSMVADPGARISELDLLPPGEAERVLALGAAEPAEPLERELLHELVAAAAARTPDAPAVVFGADRLTFRELDRRANGLAWRLRELGVRPGDRVGVCLEQSAELAVAIVGVLKSGAAYVPIDPELPGERVAYMVADAGISIAVTTPELLPAGLVPVCLDAVGERAEPVDSAVTPGDLAYVIYTSGTTGRPKGVAVQHREVLVYLSGVHDRFRVEPGSAFALLQSLAFDFGVTVFYLSLMSGGCLHLLPSRTAAPDLVDYFRRWPADYLKITPSHLAALLAEAEPGELLPRKLLILGGEAAPAEWAAELATRVRVVNHYGPTEATVGVTTHEVGTLSGMLPIGVPLRGAQVRVLDTYGRPVPVGVPGEIHLGGERLARCYLGRPGLTAEKFVPDPYGPAGSRLYRTGDLGRWLPSGELQFLGRRDLQVKVRGYRVELGEIETLLGQYPGVAQAVVDLREQRLVAYLVGEAGDTAELRAWLRERLPDYMVPARYVWLDRLPLKSHGKVDRAALPDPGSGPEPGAEFTDPATPIEETVAEVWAAVLGLERVSVLDDFFDLGGHSLLAMQVVARLRKAGHTATLLDLFKHPTVRQLAHLLDPGTVKGPARLLHRLTPPRAVKATLVCAPYGGGSAIIYKPLADVLPADWALYSLAVPGNELGEEPRPIDEVAAEYAQEILDTITGPIVLYGHCGLGVMITTKAARILEAAGRPPEAVYLGGVFPFARPRGPFAKFAAWMDELGGDQGRINALSAAGLDVSEFDLDELKLIVRNRRVGTREAERYFTQIFEQDLPLLSTPVIAVVGERDPAVEYYQERFREWHCVSATTACVVLDEAAHYFMKYRAEELADILTGTHRAVLSGETEPLERTTGEETWWLEGVSRLNPEPAGTQDGTQDGTTDGTTAGPQDGASGPSDGVSAGSPGGAPAGSPEGALAGRPDGREAVRIGPKPSMRRFVALAAGQLVSITGSALTEFALPLWIYITTGSLANFALFSVLALLPGMLVAPLAGTVVDRFDRRRVILFSDIAAGGTQLCLGVLTWTDNLQVWHIYPLLVGLSIALTFQRIAYGSAIPQIVPKRFLGHANGLMGMVNGVAQLVVPLVAAGLMAVIGLGGILIIDVVSYTVAIITVLLVRFPRTMAWRRREPMLTEMVNGFRYTWGNLGIRRMLLFFAVVNLFMSPLFILVSPLVLSFAELEDVGRVTFFGGLGVFLGGLIMTVWGGPRRLRLRGQLWSTVALSAGAIVVGLREDLVVISAGVFGMFLSLTILNGIYATIIQVKVPQRFHGRVFALNQLVAFSTLPLGFGLVAPYGTALFEPLFAEGGALATTVGAVIGTGEGRGIAFMYILFALVMASAVFVARWIRGLWRFDEMVPDALPDDVIGYETLKNRIKERV